MATFPLTGAALNLEDLEQILLRKQLLEIHQDLQLPEPVTAGTQPGVAIAFMQAHEVTQGPETPEEIIRLALLLLLHQTLIQPDSLIHPDTRKRLLALYNREVFPVVRTRGSEAARAAQLTLPLVLRGQVKFQGYTLKAHEVADIFSWPALPLQPAEAEELLLHPVFYLAEKVRILLDLKPLVNWAILIDAVYARIFSGENVQLHQGLAALVKELKGQQQNLEKAINHAEQASGAAPGNSLTLLYATLGAAASALADLNRELFRELAASAEPPLTLCFAEAGHLMNQLNRPPYSDNPAPHNFPESQFPELIREKVRDFEVLLHFAFWGFIQTDYLTGHFPETSTIQVYKQSGLFVSTETVHEQIEKISTFIKGHIPLGSA